MEEEKREEKSEEIDLIYPAITQKGAVEGLEKQRSEYLYTNIIPKETREIQSPGLLKN